MTITYFNFIIKKKINSRYSIVFKLLKILGNSIYNLFNTRAFILDCESTIFLEAEYKIRVTEPPMRFH